MRVCLLLFAVDEFPDVGAESVVHVKDIAAALVVLNAHERVIALVGESISTRDAMTLLSAMAGRRAAMWRVQETDDLAWVVRRVKIAVWHSQRQP